MVTKLDIIKKTKEILGPGGEHWGKHHFHKDDKYCLSQAIWEADFQLRHGIPTSEYFDYSMLNGVRQLFDTEVSTSIVRFNDNYDTKWPDVLAVIDKVEAKLI